MKKIILFSFISILLTGCSTVRTLLLKPEEERVPVAGLVEKIHSEREHIHTLKLDKIHFTVNTGEGLLEFNGFIGIMRDSMILMSIVPAMGYEAARIMIFQDSTLIINRVDKNYIWEENERIRQYYQIPISFRALENILMNEFIREVPVLEMRKRGMQTMVRDSLQYFAYLVEEKDEMYEVESMSSMQQAFIQRLQIKKIASGEYLKVTYEGFHKRKKSTFYNMLHWETNYRKALLEGEMKIRSYSINEEIRTQFRVPDAYQRLRI